MALEIAYYPDPILRRRAAPVLVIDDDLRELARGMLAIMYGKKGVGLAGPQVGRSARIFVMNPTGKPEDERVFVNPTIVARTGGELGVEGCLSIPEVQGKVERATWLDLEAYTLEGEEVKLELREFAARVAQHEIDHLEGILIIDKMSEAERSVASRRLKDLEEKFAERKRSPPQGSKALT